MFTMSLFNSSPPSISLKYIPKLKIIPLVHSGVTLML